MKSKNWLVGWTVSVSIPLTLIVSLVYKIDPYIHYHKPDTEDYYYSLDNERSQNDGISKHFEYDALITGTSMTENFKTSELDELFDTDSIKVPYAGGSYKEINDNLIVALENNPGLRIIVRGLDYARLLDDKNNMRNDLGTYPTYLYDNNPFNDVSYLFNKDVIFSRIYAMISEKNKEEIEPGITSFDQYARWQDWYSFGSKTVFEDEILQEQNSEMEHLTCDEKKIIYENISQNVTSLADEYPYVTFCYFLTPYSAAWWEECLHEGTIYKWIEAEQYAIELILEHKNINLFSFNMITNITTDLNNYKDTRHYGEWVNSYMLKAMHDGEELLTKENYKKYIQEELEFYTKFDYSSLKEQEDYEQDYYARALLNKEIKDVEPVKLLDLVDISMELSNSEIIDNSDSEEKELVCMGILQKNSDYSVIPYDYLINNEYRGAKFEVSNLDEYDYLIFNGRKIYGDGQPIVLIYNSENAILKEFVANCDELDNDWHQYLLDISDIAGGATILFNGGCIDNSGNPGSQYVFSDMTLY